MCLLLSERSGNVCATCLDLLPPLLGSVAVIEATCSSCSARPIAGAGRSGALESASAFLFFLPAQ